jgi:hypothetical protein
MGDDNNKERVMLSRESIGALADELEVRWGKNISANMSSSASGGSSGRKSGKRLFLWGAVSGVAFSLFVPMFSGHARPALREIVKGGIKAGKYVQKLSSEIKEDVEDLAAEAKADLDAEQST